MVIRPYALAACAVLPLVAPDVWSGFRLAQSDPVLSVIAPTEQPLSVRSPGAVWAVGLALTWLALAYWRREVKVWEAALVLVGSAFILARLGNAWVYAAAILLPLAHQLRGLELRRGRVLATAAVCLLWALVMLVATRPREVPRAARDSALGVASNGSVLADWRWASAVRAAGGGDPTAAKRVMPSGGLDSESGEFWLDYLRLAQGHQRWADILRQWKVDLVVLDTADQQRQLAGLVRDSANWRVLYDADGALVAQRVQP